MGQNDIGLHWGAERASRGKEAEWSSRAPEKRRSPSPVGKIIKTKEQRHTSPVIRHWSEFAPIWSKQASTAAPAKEPMVPIRRVALWGGGKCEKKIKSDRKESDMDMDEEPATVALIRLEAELVHQLGGFLWMNCLEFGEKGGEGTYAHRDFVDLVGSMDLANWVGEGIVPSRIMPRVGKHITIAGEHMQILS